MKSNDNIPKSRRVIFWITTMVIAIIFFVTGLGNLLPFAHIANDMAHLGYPAYFLKIMGIWKILASLATVIPNMRRIKEWVYAGMMFDLTGAALSRYFAGDAIQMAVIPFGISVLVTVNYVIRHSMQTRVINRDN